jgi:hypothetical protein
VNDTTERLSIHTTLEFPLRQELTEQALVTIIACYQLHLQHGHELTPNEFINRIVTLGLAADFDQLRRRRKIARG